MPADGGTLTATVTFPEGEILDECPEAAGLHWNGLAIEKDDLAIVSPSYRFESTPNRQYRWVFVVRLPRRRQRELGRRNEVVRPDGSARSDYRRTGSFEEVDTIGLPQAAGGDYVIPTANATPTPAKTVDVPDWYPSHDLAPRPLVSESVTNDGRSAIFRRLRPHGPGIPAAHDVREPLSVRGMGVAGPRRRVRRPGLGNVCTVETFADFYVPDHGIGGTGALTSLGTIVIVTVLTNESGLKSKVKRKRPAFCRA